MSQNERRFIVARADPARFVASLRSKDSAWGTNTLLKGTAAMFTQEAKDAPHFTLPEALQVVYLNGLMAPVCREDGMTVMELVETPETTVPVELVHGVDVLDADQKVFILVRSKPGFGYPYVETVRPGAKGGLPGVYTGQLERAARLTLLDALKVLHIRQAYKDGAGSDAAPIMERLIIHRIVPAENTLKEWTP